MSLLQRVIFVFALVLAPEAMGQVAGARVTLSAAPILEETLEWTIADSPVVVHALIEPGPADQITFTVIESIKGELHRDQMMAVQQLPGAPPLRFASGQRVLLFLQENKARNAGQFPLRLRGGRGGFLLDGTEQVYLMNLSVVSQPQQIITAAKQAAADRSEAKDYALLVCDLPYGLGVKALLFPIDPRLEAMAHKWAAGGSVRNRVAAMDALQHFKSDANIALAMRMLEDTGTVTPRGIGKWQFGYYNVRVAANDLLNKWKIWQPAIRESGPVYVYQSPSISRAAMIALAVFLLLMGVAGFIWRKTTLVRCIEVILALGTIIAIGLLWHRSTSRVDELMFASGKVHHEIASYRGGIQYLLMRDWTLGGAPAVGHFDLRTYADAWSSDLLTPQPKSRLGGFVAQNVTAPEPDSASHPATFVRIPYWALILPFVLILLHQGRLALQQIRRRRLGLCRSCGYDLRGSSSEKCSECGEALSESTCKTAAVELPA